MAVVGSYHQLMDQNSVGSTGVPADVTTLKGETWSTTHDSLWFVMNTGYPLIIAGEWLMVDQWLTRVNDIDHNQQCCS